MNWLNVDNELILDIANPIMDNLMEGSTEIDWEKHIRNFDDQLKKIIPKKQFESHCNHYQSTVGFFAQRELVGIYKKSSDVRLFWRQWHISSDDEFVAFLHLKVKDHKEVIVINYSVS